MLQDYKLGVRMLLKYRGLTIAGGVALAIAIGIGAGWYDLAGKLRWPRIPLPDGERIVTIETHNALTNEPELRVTRDFLEWRSDVRSIDGLGAYRAERRNLMAGNTPPVPIRTAALTAAAFRTARVTPLIGRGLLDGDEKPGAPGVVVLGYDAWQRSFEERSDVVGAIVKLGGTAVTVVGVMPEGFRYPVSDHAWNPLQLHASFGALEGDPTTVIGRLKPGITLEQANAELHLLGERAAAVHAAGLAVAGAGMVSLLPALRVTRTRLQPHLTNLGGGGSTLRFGRVWTTAMISVSRRTREIGVRVALGANPRCVISRIVTHAMVSMGSGVAAGGGLVLLSVALGSGPTGRAAEDVASFAVWIAVASAVTLGAGLLACIEPARLALRINPIDALRDA